MESPMKKLKFVCSYGGKIVLSSCDGSLRYQGGETRIIAVSRSITFAELSFKLAEMLGGYLVTLRCKLPNEDLDFLVTIRSDEELQSLIRDYESQSPNSTDLKIKAILSPWQPKNKTQTPPPPHPKNKTITPPPVWHPAPPLAAVAKSSRTQILGSEGTFRYWVPAVSCQQQQPQFIRRITKTGYTGGFPQQHQVNPSCQLGLAC